MVLCIMAKHPHFDLVSSKDIVPEVLRCNSANLSHAALLFLERTGHSIIAYLINHKSWTRI